MTDDSLFPYALPPRWRAHDVHELPNRLLHTYARVWQLETWLRRLVYVELRAHLGDQWQAAVETAGAARSKASDKKLAHMQTSEEDPLSYLQLSDLRRVIEAHWTLFEKYLPPQKQWDARMDEVAQVRNRVAHFRMGNERDLERVVFLLKDLDNGFWRFCTSFNDEHLLLPPSDDPVIEHFLPLDPLPLVVISGNTWARVGSVGEDVWFGVTVNVTKRAWAAAATPVTGQPGYLYDFRLFLRGNRPRYFELETWLRNTRRMHQHCVHIALPDLADEIRIVIPAVLGRDQIVEVLETMIERAKECAQSGERPNYNGTVQTLADSWPEYVIGPHHPLLLLTGDMPCSIFQVA